MKIRPEERARRRALVRIRALDYDCSTCAAHAGHPCQATGRSRVSGVALTVPHKYRIDRARAYWAVRDWPSLDPATLTTTKV